VPPLSRGAIVWVEITDPQGRNPKCRPAVVVSPNEDIKPDAELWVVGVSTEVDAAPADVSVELPWDRK
jgi:mRNA-degrading endonuclease toxin of MazEF toxin-antitoxin module